jgi:hypothetical protein
MTILTGMNSWSDIKKLDLDDPRLKQVPWTRYNKEKYTKKQVVLHHTVSGDGITGDLRHWENWRAVSTPIIIDRDGTINQLFSTRYWSYHLKAGNTTLDKQSIAVELDSWGGLIKGDGSLKQFGKRRDGSPNMVRTKIGAFYATYGNEVHCSITTYPDEFRGYNYYESYTEQQLRSLGALLLLWNDRYDIPLNYNYEMWQVSRRAKAGTPGVWSHVSYRNPKAKQDCHPDPNLIALLKTISTLT